MKKILFVFSLMLILNLSAEAYTYQRNVPYDNYGTVYPGNVQGRMYYGGNNAIIKTSGNSSYQQNPNTRHVYSHRSYPYDYRYHKKKKHHKHYEKRSED